MLYKCVDKQDCVNMEVNYIQARDGLSSDTALVKSFYNEGFKNVNIDFNSSDTRIL